TNARAADSAHAVGALAYTVGQQIVFGAGQYAPQTMSGRQLLVHELVHVVQQRQAPTRWPAALTMSSIGDAHEREADRLAALVIRGRPVTAITRTAGGPVLQKTEEEVLVPGICGPNVTKQVKDAIAVAQSAFA